MPTEIVERMLEAVHNPLEVVDLDTIIREEMDKLPPCEGATHALGLAGHVPEQPASYLLGAPCGMTRAYCKGWIEDTYNGRWIHFICPKCDELHLISELIVVPLDIRQA